jgi:hypothetical protein
MHPQASAVGQASGVGQAHVVGLPARADVLP